MRIRRRIFHFYRTKKEKTDGKVGFSRNSPRVRFFFSFSSFLLLLLLLFFSRQRRVSSRHYHHDRKHYATIAIRFLVTCSRKLKSAFSNGMEGGRLAAGSMETSRRYLRTLTRYACRSKSRSNRIF